jgi:sugar (pentulose or hexulose) kinase
MARKAGWADRFAPTRKAWDAVGFLRTELARETGLSPQVPVLAGLHDSNAALLAAAGFDEIMRSDATVLSTGTWFVAMRLAKAPVATTGPAGGRDCLTNVDPFGHPVPSARFMGGREIEMVIEVDTRQVDIKPDQPALVAHVPTVVANGAMLLPTQTPGCGPFPDREARWINRPSDWIELRTAACLYAALVADKSLDLIGSRDHLLVEGRFAEAEVFVRALASLRPKTKVFIANAHNDVALGALRLLDSTLTPAGRLQQVMPFDGDLTGYREAWRTAMRAAA